MFGEERKKGTRTTKIGFHISGRNKAFRGLVRLIRTTETTAATKRRELKNTSLHLHDLRVENTAVKMVRCISKRLIPKNKQPKVGPIAPILHFHSSNPAMSTQTVDSVNGNVVWQEKNLNSRSTYWLLLFSYVLSSNNDNWTIATKTEQTQFSKGRLRYSWKFHKKLISGLTLCSIFSMGHFWAIKLRDGNSTIHLQVLMNWLYNLFQHKNKGEKWGKNCLFPIEQTCYINFWMDMQ